MSSMTAPAPIIKAVQVPLSQDAAYALFVHKMGSWWPLGTRSISAHQGNGPALGLHIEGKNGGEIAEIAPDGSRHIWGTFLDCDEPASVSISFHMGQPKEAASHLVVSFLALGESETRVKLHHSGWESYGELAQMMRNGYDAAWDEIFGSAFVGACDP